MFKNQSMLRVLVPSLILVLALVLRIGLIFFHPVGINQDEASNLYDAWCIAETGSDRFETTPPVSLRAFGDSDYRPSLFTYLVGFVFKLTGPSLEIMRFVCVIFGLLGMLILHRLILFLSGSYEISGIALFVCAWMPWHISFSVLGHEGTALAPLLFILSVYLSLLWRRGRLSISKLVVLAFVLSFYSFSYQSSRLIAFLLALELSWHVYRSYRRKELLIFVFCCIVFTLPHIYQIVIYPEQFFGRFQSVKAVYEPFLTYGWIYFLKSVFSYVSPEWLFFNTSSVSVLLPFRLLPIAAPFFYLGLLTSESTHLRRVFLWLMAVSILPAILTVANPNPVRTSTLIYVYPCFVACGVVYVATMFRKLKRLAFLGYVLMACYSFVVLAKLYFGDPNLQKGHSQDLSETYRYIASEATEETILIDTRLSTGYVHYLWYSKTSPQDFISADYSFEPDEYGWDQFEELNHLKWAGQSEMLEKVRQGIPGKYVFVKESGTLNFPALERKVFSSEELDIVLVTID